MLDANRGGLGYGYYERSSFLDCEFTDGRAYRGGFLQGMPNSFPLILQGSHPDDGEPFPKAPGGNCIGVDIADLPRSRPTTAARHTNPPRTGKSSPPLSVIPWPSAPNTSVAGS